MNYRDYLKEGEDVLAAMPEPTKEEDAALSLELARENAEGFIELDEVDLGEDGPECEFCGVAVPDGQSAYAPYCSLECRDEAEAATEARIAAGTEPEPVWPGDLPPQMRDDQSDEYERDPDADDGTCPHGVYIWRSGDCEKCAAEQERELDCLEFEEAEGLTPNASGVLVPTGRPAAAYGTYPDKGGDPDGQSDYAPFCSEHCQSEAALRGAPREPRRAERCDHCLQRVGSGTCYGGGWWCDRCLDAEEAAWDATHQAHKDRDREPDRW